MHIIAMQMSYYSKLYIKLGQIRDTQDVKLFFKATDAVKQFVSC